MRMEGDWGRPAWMGFENAFGFFFRPSGVFEMRRDLGLLDEEKNLQQIFRSETLCEKGSMD